MPAAWLGLVLAWASGAFFGTAYMQWVTEAKLLELPLPRSVAVLLTVGWVVTTALVVAFFLPEPGAP